MTGMSHRATPPLMKLFPTPITRRLAAAAVVACGALFGAPLALACGTGGYSYAGLAATSPAFGIGATVTPLSSFGILSGHVAGWVGVGGPRQGPNGSNEWLQVGFSGFPELTGNNIYYELALPNRTPVYHQIAANLPSGKPARFAVLEMHHRPNVWRVWLNGSAVSGPITLPGSHGRWSPMATAESWDGGTGGGCNDFLYRFHRVSIAHAPGGGWRQVTTGYPIQSAATRIQRRRGSSGFLGRKAGRPSSSSPLLLDPDRRAERRVSP